jgi:MFS family permease
MSLPGRAVLIIIATNLGALPIAMRALVLVLLGHHNTGSYAVAGTAAALAAIGLALSAPLFGRMLGRYGHRRVLLATGAAAAAAHIWLAVSHQPIMFVLLAAAVGLTSPPIMSSGRALLPDLVAEDALTRAYTYNALVQELLYVGGPLWISLWIILSGPPAALLACAAVGTAALAVAALAVPGSARSPLTAAPPTTSPLRRPAVQTLVSVHLAYMACMGAMWVLVPAFATEAGHPDQGALLVTAWALGSVAGGVAFAVRGRRRPLQFSYLALLGLLAVTALPLAAPATLPQMAIVIAVFGLGLSPWLATADELVSHTSPTGTAGEAYGWLMTTAQIGSAGGSVLAGMIADRQAIGAPFLIVAGALLIAFTIAFLRRQTLQNPLPSSVARHSPAAVPLHRPGRELRGRRSPAR